MLKLPFKKLLIWQKGRKLVKVVYTLSRKLPRDEERVLGQQMRRAVLSIPSNIAEGSQRTSSREFLNYLLMAKGSLAELETQLLLACDLGYLSNEEAQAALRDTEEVNKMIYVFYKKLSNKQSPPH